MLRHKDFVVFSDDWGRHPFSCQHLMRRFLPENRLLWVQTIGLRTPRLTLYDAKRSLEKIRSWLGPPAGQASLPERLYPLAPVMAPFNRVPGVRSFNRTSVIRAVRRAMWELGMDSPILLATLPNACDYAGALGESLVVYYCVDDFSLWPGMNQPELVRDMEQKLLEQADLVVATSEALQASRTTPRGPTRLLPHGVDTEHFAKALPPPEAMRDLRSPVIGFYGLIDERLDWPLLEETARRRPGWNIVLIGRSLVPIPENLAALPNFHTLPPVDYEELPAYAACFDAAVVPYRLDKLTDAINPLKVREYLAAGKPVAGTPLPELRRLAPAVHVGGGPGEGPEHGADGFIAAVEAALADETPPEARRRALAGHSWADRAELFSSWLEEALEETTFGQNRAKTPDATHSQAGTNRQKSARKTAPGKKNKGAV